MVARRTSRQRLLAIAPFLVFLAVLLWISLPVGLGSLGGSGISVLTYSRDAAVAFGAGDSGSLLRAAISLRDSGAILDDQRWVFNVWPPGMLVVDVALLGIESATGIPIVLLMVIFTCVVLAVFLGCAFAVIRAIGGWVPAILFGIGVVLYSGVSGWSLRRGLFYSDTFGVIGFGFALLCLLLLFRAETVRARWMWAVLAGVSLATGAYFRASFEVVATGTLLVAGLVLVVALLARWRQKWRRFSGGAISALLPLVVMSAVAQVVMLPWRIYVGVRNHPGDFRWSALSELASVARWLPEPVLRENNLLSSVLSHSNWACQNDPEQCQAIYTLEQTAQNPYGGSNGGYYTAGQFDQFVLGSFFAHPFTFIAERIEALGLGFVSNTGLSLRAYAMPESIVIVALFIATVVVFIRTRAFANPAYLFFFIATLGQVATLLLLHMEPRYFLGIELSTIIMGSAALATVYRNRRPVPGRPAEELP